MDAFDFNLLKKTTPKYLGLDSIRDALPTNDEPNSIDDTEIADVSMQDQILDDEVEDTEMRDSPVLESEEPINMNTENEENNKNEEIPAIESVNTEEPNDFSDHSKDTKSNETNTNETDHNVDLLSPTKYGAQHALQPLPDHSYKYEIHMPIPTPWNENIPYILSTYLQLAFNLMIISLLVWIFYIFKRDVSLKIRERSQELIHKSSWCHEQYLSNNCQPGKSIPYLQDSQFCLEMEKCMETDPENVRWLSMHASLLAEVINELIEPLTWHTMITLVVLSVLLGLLVFGVNYLFGFVRARSYYTEPKQSPSPSLVRHPSKTVKISAISGPSEHIWNHSD